MHDSEPFIEDFDPFCDIQIMGGPAVERLKFRIVPEKFRCIQDFRMEADEISLDE